MAKRYSPKLTITLPQQLVDHLALYQAEYDLPRSVIIHQALTDWLAKQQPLEIKSDELLLINDRPYELGKYEHDYLTPDMSPEKAIDTMVEFEAARDQHYNRRQYGN